MGVGRQVVHLLGRPAAPLLLSTLFHKNNVFMSEEESPIDNFAICGSNLRKRARTEERARARRAAPRRESERPVKGPRALARAGVASFIFIVILGAIESAKPQLRLSV